MSDTTSKPAIEISADQLRAIRQLFDNMPYMAGRTRMTIRTADHIIEALEEVVVTLRDVAARDRKNEKDLDRLKDQQRAVGEFLTEALAVAKPKQD